jgi:phospholipase/lecithinase/hemolysin
MKKRLIVFGLIALVFLFPFTVRAATYGSIVVFGDSLSDNGNVFELTGGTLPDPIHYYQGRFSNGPVWVEYLAQQLNLTAQLVDEACGGATTGGEVPPGLRRQVTTYVATSSVSQDALFVIWAGANDYLSGGADYIGAVANVFTALQTLTAAGARHILVLNLPNLGATPSRNGSAASYDDALSYSTNFNMALLRTLESYPATAGVELRLLDVFSLFEAFGANPSRYGFTNVRDSSPQFGVSFNNQEGYLFWDDLHPTTEAHALLGAAAAAMLNLNPTTELYFPHIASNEYWETEIAIINQSADTDFVGVLRAYTDAGAEVPIPRYIGLAPHARKEITIGEEYGNAESIGYLVLESGTSAVRGYTKFYRYGQYRAAIPAVAEINTGDSYLSHVTANPAWWTGVSLVNTTAEVKNVTIEFNDGTNVSRSLAGNEHKKFLISDLFGGQTPAGVSSAVLTNASGVIGLELFGSEAQLEGIPITDEIAMTLYYPHVTADSAWWTGIVAYNPAPASCSFTMTPYASDGTPLTSTVSVLNGEEKYNVVAGSLGLPQETAWLRIDGTGPLTGFELCGTTDWSQVAGFYGIGAEKRQGVFAKIEKGGGWTYLVLTNTENTPAAVTMTACNDNGIAVSTTTFTINGYGKMEHTAAEYFSGQDITQATYVFYSSDKDLMGLQLNRSADSTMLDGLPGL